MKPIRPNSGLVLKSKWLPTMVCITGYATHKNAKDISLLSINKIKLKKILGFPSNTDLNLVKYYKNPTDHEICIFVEFLGYNEPLAKTNEFMRGRQPPFWNTLFSILNRILTSKT